MIKEKEKKIKTIDVRVDVPLIRQLMKKRGITSNAELARLSGLHNRTMAYVMSQKRNVNIGYQTLTKIATAMGVLVNDLIVIERTTTPSKGNGGPSHSV